MSEFVNELLNKISEIGNDAAKIKERFTNSNNGLKPVLEEVKSLIDSLCEYSNKIKEEFKVRYDEASAEVASRNSETADDSQLNTPPVASLLETPAVSSLPETPAVSTLPETPAVAEPVPPIRPTIKLVDINKLVEPRAIIKKANAPLKEKKTVQFDDTIITLSSSDDSCNDIRKSMGKRKTTRKSKKIWNMFSSPELSDDDKDIDDKDDPITTATRCKTKNGKYIESPVITDSVSNDWEKDPRFKAKTVVNLLRVPCEKMKKFYADRDEILEIKRLTSLGSLGKRRTRRSIDLSSEKHRQGKKKNKKTSRNEISASESTSSSRESSDSENEGDNIREVNEKRQDLAAKSKSAELALQLIESDKDSEDSDNNQNLKMNDSNKETGVSKEMANETAADENDNDTAGETTDKDESNKLETDGQQKSEKNDSDKEKINEQKSVEESSSENEKDASKEKTEKDEVSEGKSSDRKNKESKSTDEDGEKGDEEPKSDEEKKSEKSKSDTDEENEDKSEDDKNKDKKKKSAWKNDRLLNEKLSSSDSEEDMRKFKKKKAGRQEKSSDDDDDDEVTSVNLKRGKKRLRKAVVSDSDSDYAGNKKDQDSDEEDVENKKSSSSSSESENEKQEEIKPARKRVKKVADSSDDDDEKSTRKQIRKVLGRSSLSETTKKAEDEEKERKARIAEKQDKYNKVFNLTTEHDAKVEKVVLDFDADSKEELLKVDETIVEKLKPHQAAGIRFMWDACFESLERTKTTKGSGCILAHCMGLGKTLQVIALTHTLLMNREETGVNKVMVVCPLNTVLNWVSEYKQWMPDEDDFEVFELVSWKQNYERQHQVKEWHKHGGVLIIGYEMYRNLSNPENKRISKKMRTTFQETLVDPGPDLVVCDEGHLLKNEKTNLSIAMNRLKTLRRIVLTGTPLQNNLREYFCMVQFIKPNLLGTYKEYLNRFVNPITNGQYTDSTPHDIQIMRKRSHVLHKMLDGIVQRRDYGVLRPYLPPKYEYVLFINLTETQIKLYEHYMQHFARRSSDGKTSFLFVDFQSLQRICTHPRVLLDKSNQEKLIKEKNDEYDSDSEGSLRDFIDDSEEESSSSGSDKSSSDDNAKSKKPVKKRVTRAMVATGEEEKVDERGVGFEISSSKEWWQEYCDGEELDNIANSSKLFLLFEILKECEQIGDKVLLFSQSLYSLNIIEYFLGKVHDATQANETLGGYTGSWCLGLDYFRLDGSSSCDNRSAWCNSFNKRSNTRARLFLISTRAGGLGINLVAANRVIIFDVSWNPSHDIQSIYRVYRFGQLKPCYVYRFVTNGAMEMKIYERQVTKQAISKRVIDEQQIDRHYNQNDLTELYKFEPKPETRPTPFVPKDVLLAEMLQKFDDKIYKYHEHQSLLENKEDEVLNEEERKAAWEEFENEKVQRSNIGGPASMVQSTHLVRLALLQIAKRDYPGWTDKQVQALLPALSQQLTESVTLGDFTMYRRVQQEMAIIQTQENERFKKYYQQQAALKLFQQQQNLAGIANFIPNTMPGTSQRTPQYTSEVIELND